MCTILYISVYDYAQPQYTLTDLGTFSPSAIAGPYVVGSENGAPVRLNHQTGEKLILGNFGAGGYASAVLASGVAVGTTKLPDQNAPEGVWDMATFWDAQGSAYGLPGGLPSSARGINEAWTIAGHAACVPEPRAVRWWPGQSEPECQQGSIKSNARGIDGQHRVWGWGGLSHVMMWDVDGTVHDFGLPPQQAYGETRAVNGEGVAVGFSAGAWMFSQADGFAILPRPPGKVAVYCAGLGINRHRQVVGWCNFTSGGHTALFWPTPTQVFDLDTLIPGGASLHSAVGINDDGVIVALRDDGRGALLTPRAPMIDVAINRTSVTAGQTLTVGLSLSNPTYADVYFGFILPWGQFLWVTQVSPLQTVLTNATEPETFKPVSPRPYGTNPAYFSYTFTGAEVPGPYHVVAALVPPGALADGRIDDGDMLALDWAFFTVTRPRGQKDLSATMRGIQEKHGK
jgi:uncharacterized membrane protein